LKLRCCASISGTILIFDIKEYISLSNTVLFDIEAPRNEKWLISGIFQPPDIEESSILNAFSSISYCSDIKDSMILAFIAIQNIIPISKLCASI
jgi:hypothetical protein